MEYIDIESITPLHGVRNQSHADNLSADMNENGWQGRPLLVIEREDDFLAWTGSHRLAAAKTAGFSVVPCYVLQESELTKHGFDAQRGHVMDFERLAIVREIGDEIALSLMNQEGRA